MGSKRCRDYQKETDALPPVSCCMTDHSSGSTRAMIDRPRSDMAAFPNRFGEPVSSPFLGATGAPLQDHVWLNDLGGMDEGT